jgi:ABC-type transport system involved in multi-copper enzyme maturation permease subunit
MNSYLVPFLFGIGWCLVQAVAALPWLAALDPNAFRSTTRRPVNWLIALGAAVIVGAGLALFTGFVQDPTRLMTWGRIYGGILQAQLVIDFFVIIFPLLLLVWPKGGAVALAAFREGFRQPMFWLIVAIIFGLMVITPFLPYYTFGEDYKMVRELGYDMIMLGAVVFGVLAASTSISEEIEGRTAITVMSKPVSRRQFLIGKFIGILGACLLMIGMLGWAFDGVMWGLQGYMDNSDAPLPGWVEPMRQAWSSLPEVPLSFGLGIGVWFDASIRALPGLIFGGCQVMVLVAIAVALATRLPMVVNIVTCVAIFFLGHLTHVLVLASTGRMALVNFMAKFFDNVLPGLEYFDYGSISVRDIPLDPGPFTAYVASVLLYAVVYSIIALLLGLVLFEDRDLA